MSRYRLKWGMGDELYLIEICWLYMLYILENINLRHLLHIGYNIVMS